MSDLRVMRWLRSIDSKIDEMKADRDRALAEIDGELQEHEDRLDGLDDKIADVTRRVDRLETRFDRTLQAMRSPKKPAKKG